MNNIKELRKRYSITQDELGQRIGVKKAAICKYENGSCRLPENFIPLLCDVFSVSADELLGRVELRDGTFSGEASGQCEERRSLPEVAQVPLLGRVHAGLPILAVENISEYIPLAAADVRGGEFFYMEVEGDCMTGDFIPEGARILVRRQSNASNGDIIVARVEDEVLLRRIKFASTHIVLIPSNPKYEPMIVSGGDFEIVGKVVEVRFFT